MSELWYTTHDIPLITHPVEFKGILDLEHPGAKDPNYRARREAIAAASRRYREDPAHYPVIEYTDVENRTWQIICEELRELHSKHAVASYLTAWNTLQLPSDRVPHLHEVDAKLRKHTRMRLMPIEGLVDARSFISSFRNRVMMSTQYIRHASRPTFTPEPDIVHEVVGHVPMLIHEEIVEFLEMLGRSVHRATDEQVNQIALLYWFTVEYGLIEENGRPKAFGAGLLGGIEDLKNATRADAPLKLLDLDEIWHTQSDYSFLQSTYFVTPSFAHLKSATFQLLSKLRLLDA